MKFFSTLKRSLIFRIAKIMSPFSRPTMMPIKKNFQGDWIKNVRISNSTFIDHKENLVLKDHVYIGHHNFIEASNEITVGVGTQITSHVTITTHSSHISIRLQGTGDLKSESKSPIGYVKGSIRIGDFTFVGPHTVIAPGAIIGNGCIISAFSYVKGTFPDFSMIAGNPAKVVGDVRKMDKEFLEKHPELSGSYMV
jgi:acetyltransferase-like isoleucine patch superfamily enzyme